MNIYEKLTKVQNEMKVPKGNYNSFGKYKYRKQEDILEAVKPLLLKYGLSLFMSDEIVLVNERYYIKAVATLIDVETSEKIINTALAREEESKKGMDSCQVTGGASSYARKYALNGLFAVDDTEQSDSDATNETIKGHYTHEQQQGLPMTTEQSDALKTLMAAKKLAPTAMPPIVKQAIGKSKSSKDLTYGEANSLLNFLNNMTNEQTA